MIAAVLTGALICAAALACGQAVLCACGRDRVSPLAPAVGLSVLLVVCGIAIALPGHGIAAAIAAALALAASAAVLWRRRPAVPPGAAIAAAVAIAAGFLALVPFLASGRMGILGAGLINDDMASHLLFADWLDSRNGPEPELMRDGYPVGPHSLVAAVARATGATLVESFAGLTLALAALAALTAYGALGGPARSASSIAGAPAGSASSIPSRLRAPAALLAAFPYLAAAYLVSGAFKEPALALLVIGFALGLPRAAQRGAIGGGLPLGAIAAGTVYLYSFPGLVWLAGTAAIWWLASLLRARRAGEPAAIAERLRAARPVLLAAAVLPLVAALPAIGQLIDFTSFRAFDPGGSGPRVGLGNLRHAIPASEALGIWPSSEYRITISEASAPAAAFYLGIALAAAALAWGTWRLARRGEVALPAALAAATFVYLGALVVGTPYTSAKALAIASPLVALVVLRGLLVPGADATEGERRRGRTAGSRTAPARIAPARIGRLARIAPARIGRLARIAPARIGRPARYALVAAFALGAAVSSFLPIRSAPVGPDHHARELAQMRPLLQGEKVLFLGRESFVAWELIGARVFTPIVHHFNVKEVEAVYRATAISGKFDPDAVSVDLLDGFRWVITSSAAQQSEFPAGYRPAVRTRDYVLWERVGPVGPRSTLPEPSAPGAILDCEEPRGRALARRGGRAAVFPTMPVTGASWEPTANVTDSSPGRDELLLGPGRWRISLQYAATEPIHVRGPGLDATLRANLDYRGPSAYWPVGEITVRRRSAVRFEVGVDPPPRFGRLIGAEGLAYLGPIAATPAGPRRRIPLARACGRYVDWYAPRSS